MLMLPFLAVLLHVPLMRFVPLAHTLFPFGAESSAPAATAAAVHAPVYGAARDNGVSRHVEALFLNSSCAGAECLTLAAMPAAVHTPVCGAASNDGVPCLAAAHFLNSSRAGAKCLTLAAMTAAVHAPVCGAASNDGVSRLAAAHCAGSHCPTRCGGEALRAAQRVVAVAGTTGTTGGTRCSIGLLELMSWCSTVADSTARICLRMGDGWQLAHKGLHAINGNPEGKLLQQQRRAHPRGRCGGTAGGRQLRASPC